MYCKNCGNKVAEGVKFCGKCGQPMGVGTAPVAAVAPKKSGMSTGAKIILAIVIGVPVLGILSSIVLVSLNTAREKGAAAQTEEINGGWEKFTPVGGKFSALFPTYPESDSSDDTTSDGNSYTYNSYIARKGTTTFNVFQWLYTDPIDTSDPQALLEHFLNGFINGTSGTLVSSNFTYNGTMPAVDFLIDADQEYIKGQLILDGQIPYLVAEDYATGEYVDADYQRFINSFVTN